MSGWARGLCFVHQCLVSRPGKDAALQLHLLPQHGVCLCRLPWLCAFACWAACDCVCTCVLRRPTSTGVLAHCMAFHHPQHTISVQGQRLVRALWEAVGYDALMQCARVISCNQTFWQVNGKMLEPGGWCYQCLCKVVCSAVT